MITAKWIPFPQQAKALVRTEFEILYGGARGGGKTDAGMAWLLYDKDNSNYRALVIRRNADDLSDWIDRAQKMYYTSGAMAAYRPPYFTFPSGAIIRTGHLRDENAYTKYQGHEYHKMLIEELTQIPEERRYLQLVGSCRSTIPELRPQVFGTTNPGGVGHEWVKARWRLEDKENWGIPFTDPEEARGARIFIHAGIDDNPILKEVDPGYVLYLDGLKKTDEQLYKAWRLGSWEVFAGQALREWNPDIHVINHLPIGVNLDDCYKIICFDWGYEAPGCAYWLAVTPENQYGAKHLFVYRELYQNHRKVSEWADELRILTSIEEIKFMVLPHDCYMEEKGHKSIASIFEQALKPITILPARTLSHDARKNRLALMHEFLGEVQDGKPYLQFLSKCVNAIKTLPTLIIDEKDIEDIDTTGQDHAYDAITAGLMTLQDKLKLLSGPIRPKITKKEGLKEVSPGVYRAPDFAKKFKEAAKKPHRGVPENR